MKASILSLSRKVELLNYFILSTKLKSKIDATNYEIDLMFYKEYDLTEEEIKIV